MNHDYQCDEVRDLAWVMASPSLLSAETNVISDNYCQSVYQDNRDWLYKLDENPEPLRHWIKQNQSSRLGFYFEQLVAFWLKERIANGFFESHCRVFRDKRVLGEFDFLFTTPESDVLNHWETAVKFYLCFQADSGEYRWYGPNVKDRLDIKLAHMMNHQLRLSDMPEGSALLTVKGFQHVQSRAFMKGYLFYPSDTDWQRPDHKPEEISGGHLKGWWTRCNDLTIPGLQQRYYDNCRWIILPRLQWLAPQRRNTRDIHLLLDREQLLTELQNHFTNSQRPLLLAEMNCDTGGVWREQSRGFVVGASWPESTA